MICFRYMDGPLLFLKGGGKISEVIIEALTANGYQPSDIDLLIPHQANLRISQMVQHKLKLRDDQVYITIFRNTVTLLLPPFLLLYVKHWENGKVKR